MSSVAHSHDHTLSALLSTAIWTKMNLEDKDAMKNFIYKFLG